MRFKARVHEVLEYTKEGDRVALLVMMLITALIFISLAGVIIESVASLRDQYWNVLYAAEVVTVAVFTVEYALRIWSCTEDARYSRPIVGRLRYAVSLFALIDLVAILPFYLPLAVAFDSRFVRSLRLIRIFRIAKMARYSNSVDLLTKVAKKQKETLLVSIAIIIILIVIASCVMWQVESEAQPEKFASIPDAMWWSVATITTVGYGDVVPITPLGRLCGSFIAIMGVCVIALPAGIVVSGFIDVRNEEEKAVTGKRIEEAEKKLDLLERLGGLKEKGLLTDMEFQQEKEILIRCISPHNEKGKRRS